MDRFKSKKFWLTVLTVLGALFGGSETMPTGDIVVDPLAMSVAGVVAALYVFFQSRIDRAKEISKALLDNPQLRAALEELGLEVRIKTRDPVQPGTKSSVLIVTVLLFSCLCLVGCPSGLQEPSSLPGRCSDAALLQMETEYTAEVITACAGQSFDSCAARAPIERRYKNRREEWIQCRR